MAREFPIHNGRMTTDLDANGHRIKNLPPGSGFTQVQSDWGQTDTTAPDYIKNKPTIPAPVTVDPALSPTSENPVQNKAVAAALLGKLDGAVAYPVWDMDVSYAEGGIVFHRGRLWRASIQTRGVEPGTPEGDSDWSSEEVTIDVLKQDALSQSQLAAVNSGATAAKVATWDGYSAQIAAKANAADVATALAQKASLTDLPYALVTPGEWEFSGVPEGVTDVSLSWDGTIWNYTYVIGTNTYASILPIRVPPYDGNELSLTFSISSSTVTATRPSLPGHLLDRAGNRVVVTGDTTLTLPAAVPGYIRDFLVRLEISGSTVPTITFAAPTGETITYETDGDEFPVPDEAGTWSYSFTENCVAHKFAVSLKKVNTVAAPQAQGGA